MNRSFVNWVLVVCYLSALVIVSCKCNEPGLPKKPCPPSSSNKIDNSIQYNIFIENSGSMNGYFTGASDFKKVLVAFVSDIPTQLNINPGLYFVNSNVCKQLPDKPTKELVYFIQNLNPANSKQLCPSNGTSLLPNVIDLCTQDMGNKVNILISDCIFSDGDANNSLHVAQANLKMFMAKKLKDESISSLILKYHSGFKGTYYMEIQNSKGVSLNAVRPYYIMIFGKREKLRDLLRLIHFKNYPGFEDNYMLASQRSSERICAAITLKDKMGSFEFEKPATNLVIKEARPDKNKNFQFSIDINLADLGMEENYLLNSKNYIADNDFKVVTVKKAESGNFSHSIILHTNKLKPKSEIKIGLKYDIPDWVIKTGSEDDSNPNGSLQQQQTFGFKYLMEGFSQAYKACNNATTFNIPIYSISIQRD